MTSPLVTVAPALAVRAMSVRSFQFVLSLISLLLVAPTTSAQSSGSSKVISTVTNVASLTAPALVTQFRSDDIVRGLAPITGALNAVYKFATVTAAASNEGQAVKTGDALIATGGVFAIVLLIGIITLILAEGPLVAAAKTAAKDVSRSFWIGALWQLLSVPLLAIIIAALTATVVGIVAIPFVVLAWTLAFAGAFTLGFLAVAYLIGRAIGGGGKDMSSRSIEVRALTIGVLILGIVWLLAALLVAVPFAGIFARIVALALTWVVATVGMGAVVRSRGGKRADPDDYETDNSSNVPLWQTPTPVGGVVAAVKPAASAHLDI